MSEENRLQQEVAHRRNALREAHVAAYDNVTFDPVAFMAELLRHGYVVDHIEVAGP